MSPQESRTIWCLVEGYPNPYDIFDIPIEANVNRLKLKITQTVNSLRDTDPYNLTLLKLDKVVPIGPGDTLVQRLSDLGNIDAYSRKLSPEERIGVLFPESHSEDNLQIVVRCPPSRKRSRSATEEGGQAAKRREIDGDAPNDVQTCSAAIHKAIKTMSDNLDLSNPSTFTTLPFPSWLSIPSQRFETKEINGVVHFEYMGRLKFRELEKCIEKQHFLNACESLYLYGTSGSGKSHLLAALVYHLIREGERVFYIPDCSSLLLNGAAVIRAALTFAFYDSPVLGTIDDLHDVDALISWVARHQNVYIIVDQVNALDPAENDSLMKAKVQASRWLRLLRFKHRYIFSASANEISNREADRKQSGIAVFPIFGGMSSNETEQWFIQHCDQIPQLSAEQRQCVEHLTGSIPLLLRCLFTMTNFDEREFRNIPDLLNVSLQVDSFFRTKLYSLQSLSKQTYLNIMRACVQGNLVEPNDRSLYDLRHFYVDEKGIGRFTCGIAFEKMMSMLRIHDTVPFVNDMWYTAVSRSSNPVVRGFLAEQICLAFIADNGLMAVDPKLSRMSTVNFDTQPDFAQFLSTDHKIRLYVPFAYNFRAVDGVILLLDRPSKKATMFSIQFTLSLSHKQSDEEFHRRLWLSWTEPIVSAGFSVHSTFVWIDKKQLSDVVKPKVVRVLRSGDKIVHPEYSVVHVGVKSVNKRLASFLGIV